MRRLILCVLILNVLLISDRIWQTVAANSGGAAGVEPCATINGDVNNDDDLDFTDAIAILSHIFLGDPAELVPFCEAQGGGLTPEQEEILSYMSIVDVPIDDAGNTVPTVRFSGINVQIVNGTGSTDGAVNGLGNLVIGYQEVRNTVPGPGCDNSSMPDFCENDRTGSHNLAIGKWHNYRQNAGLLAGSRNSTFANFSAALGLENSAEAIATTITGGLRNRAIGITSSVSGGTRNVSDGATSTVSGGENFVAAQNGSHVPLPTSGGFPVSNRGGLAILYPDKRLQQADGQIVDVSSSPSAGIQELFDYCRDNFADAYIVGGVESSTFGPIVYNSQVPIVLHPQQGFRLDTGIITINFTSNLGSQNGLTIESSIIADVRIRGQIVYFGSSYAVAFKGTQQVPLDPVTSISDNSYFIGAVAVVENANCVLFDGSVAFNNIFFNEINGGQIGVDVRDSTAGVAGNYARNRFNCRHIHGQFSTGVRVRGGGGGNIWEVNVEPDFGRNPIGIDTGISNDIWFANLVSNGQPSLIVRSGARRNQFHLMEVQGGIQDSGTNTIVYTAP
jgi:hypothetical protein